MGRPTPVGFEEMKAAQVAYFLAGKSQQGMDKMKLIKLIYLAEREFVSRHGHPMLFDELYSLEHGPICSNALNGINLELDEQLWKSLISKVDNTIVAKAPPKRESLDHVSNAELNVLEHIWEQYGEMSASELREFTHKHCEEYTEVPKGKRLEISYAALFDALGFEDPENCEERIVDTRRAINILSY